MEKFVRAAEIELWSEDFGEVADPPILLIMGGSAQGIHWPDEFCQALAAGGRHVIRYDARDTGRSTRLDFDKSPYTLADMARDAGLLLDGWSIDRAHVVGASMGGMVAQEFAIHIPQRTLTLTSWMSSPVAGAPNGKGWSRLELPAVPAKVQEFFQGVAASPPKTRSERIEVSVHKARVLHGTAVPFDEALHRALADREIDRAQEIAIGPNHDLAVARSEDRTERLGSVTAPTLVIYGTADPIAGKEHAEATAQAIPGSRLLAIEGMGHELPFMQYPFSRVIVDAILDLSGTTGGPD